MIEAEKFITLIKQDKFDYTQWRKNLWEDKSLEENIESYGLAKLMDDVKDDERLSSEDAKKYYQSLK